MQIIKKTIEQNDEAFFLQNTFPISLIYKNLLKAQFCIQQTCYLFLN